MTCFLLCCAVLCRAVPCCAVLRCAALRCAPTSSECMQTSKSCPLTGPVQHMTASSLLCLIPHAPLPQQPPHMLLTESVCGDITTPAANTLCTVQAVAQDNTQVPVVPEQTAQRSARRSSSLKIGAQAAWDRVVLIPVRHTKKSMASAAEIVRKKSLRRTSSTAADPATPSSAPGGSGNSPCRTSSLKKTVSNIGSKLAPANCLGEHISIACLAAGSCIHWFQTGGRSLQLMVALCLACGVAAALYNAAVHTIITA